jgi:hypothetical protein
LFNARQSSKRFQNQKVLQSTAAKEMQKQLTLRLQSAFVETKKLQLTTVMSSATSIFTYFCIAIQLFFCFNQSIHFALGVRSDLA